MQVVVGSSALREHFPDFREPKDIDVLCDESPKEAVFPAGIADVYQVKTFKLEDWFDQELPSIDQLYTLKVSHIFWDNKFDKHISDIRYMQRSGAQVILPLYKVLYAEWENLYGKKKANLNVSAEDFFQSTVTRVYEHDSIHQSVAYYEEPLFNKILKDGSEVMVDVKKFWALSEIEKLQLVREEVYATALERMVIPSGYKYNARRAYWWALKKTITSFSKGWFPLFIVENIDKLWKPEIDYVKKHLDNKDMLIPLEEK